MLPRFFSASRKNFEMSELCNNSAGFSVEVKGTSDICVTFVFFTLALNKYFTPNHICPAAEKKKKPLLGRRFSAP